MKKILIVDNVAATAEREKNMLVRGEFIVFTALTAEAALEIHRAQQVDLIAVSINLQDMPCDEFCARIRNDENLCHVSLVAIGQDAEKDSVLVALCKVNAYISLPLHPAQFLEKIGQLLQIPIRKSYRVLFKVTVTGSRGEESFFCNSQNISASGVLIETAKQLGKGDRISCSFFLPGSGQVTTAGDIVRVSKKDDAYQYGVRFVDMKPLFRGAIEKFIKKRAARP